MTVKLDAYEFDPAPSISIGSEAELAEKKILFGGTTKEYTGVKVILITLEGQLTGANRYTDRNALMAIISGGVKVNFYADTITYGSVGSPKSVWVRGYNFIHTRGDPNVVPFQIILEVET